MSQEQQQAADASSSSTSASAATTTGGSSQSACRPWPHLASHPHGLYRYEAKPAGGVYEYLMRLTASNAGNNSNTVPDIKDVQVHKSQRGQNTRVETELQTIGTAADLNINIIMDSESNLSNALGHASIEYESLDQTGASDEDAPSSAPLVGSRELAEDADIDGGRSGGGGGGGSGGYSSGEEPTTSGGSPTSGQPSTSTGAGGSSRDDDGRGVGGIGSSAESSPQSATVSSGSGRHEPDSSIEDEPDDSQLPGSRRAANTDDAGEDDDKDDGGDDDDEDEGVEGEEGDMDDAQRHFQRYLDGEKLEALRGPGREEEVRETRRRLPVGHLEKEGVVIGCMSVFADVHIKEFIVFLSDEMIQAFLVDPGRFRSVANRTKCEIEVTRRILNRRMGRYRWLKYLIVAIRGPSYSSIDQCDKMMISLFPPYKGRKPYGMPAMVSLFLRETTPDNTDLYYNYQRTGPSQHMFGEIPLRAPFRKTRSRPLETTPWKAANKRQQWGVLDPKNDRMEKVMSHVYPERGGTVTESLAHAIKWAEAAEEAVAMSKAKDMARAMKLKARKADSEPLFANVVGE